MKHKNFKSLEKASIIFIFIFGLMIFIPLIAGISLEDKLFSGVEKRSLAKAPGSPKNIKQLNEFPRVFEQYYADHFGYREEFTKQYFKLMKKIGSSSSLDDVTIGLDDWLFLGSVKAGYIKYDDPMGDVENVNLYSLQDLEAFAKALTEVNNWLANKGIEYFYVIAPNKHTIYFDKLPDYIKKHNDYSATDQLVAYIQKNTNVSIIDLRDALQKAKTKGQLYYKQDTHWNNLGANIAQYEIAKHIKAKLPESILPRLLNKSEFKIAPFDGGDLADMAQIKKMHEDQLVPLFNGGCPLIKKPVEAKELDTHSLYCKKSGLRALVFRDSFFTALQPYLARYFSTSLYLTEKINGELLKSNVNGFKPNIVIEELVERKLPYVHRGLGY